MLGGLLTCLALAMAGVWLGLRVATPGEYETRLGRVSVRVEPSATGQLEAYVPLADWGVRLRPFSAPLKFHIEPRTADREVVLRAAAGESGLVTAAEADLRSAVRKTVLRALRFALAGAALLAVMLALSLAAFRVRNRAVLVGAPLAVIALAAAVCGISVLRADSTFDPDSLDHPTFYARGSELVQLLDAAENARQAGDSYTSKVQGAVRGFASLLADPTGGSVDAGRPALLASDLHNNAFALDSLRDYASGKPVFFVGDFGNTGSAAETRPARAARRPPGRSRRRRLGQPRLVALHARARAPRGDRAHARGRAAPRRRPRAGEHHRQRAARGRLRRPAGVARRAVPTIRAGSSRSPSCPTRRAPRPRPTATCWPGTTGSSRAPTSSSSTRTGSPSASRARSTRAGSRAR